MSGAADYPKARAWLETPEGGAWQAALERLLEAREQERGANSNEAREAAEQAWLAADAAMAKATGVTELRRRRILRELDDLPVGEKVDAADYTNRIQQTVGDASPVGRTNVRFASARLVLDLIASVGAALVKHLAGALMQVAGGKRSMLDVDHHQGCNPTTGAAFMLRKGIVKAAGYEAGVLYGTGRIGDVLWVEAAAIHNAAAKKLRRSGEPCEPVSAKTVRDWCVRKRDKKGIPNEHYKNFEAARREGMTAAKRDLIDPTARLAASRK